MEEKQNEEKVTLDNILDEIRSVRKKVAMQRREALFICGIGIAFAIFILGFSIWATILESPKMQWFDSLFSMLVGSFFIIRIFKVWDNLENEEQKETHKETKND